MPSNNLFFVYPSDLPIEKIQKCMGDPEADVENDVLKTEQDLQVFAFPISFSCSCPLS
jgi:hypothetical protein